MHSQTTDSIGGRVAICPTNRWLQQWNSWSFNTRLKGKPRRKQDNTKVARYFKTATCILYTWVNIISRALDWSILQLVDAMARIIAATWRFWELIPVQSLNSLCLSYKVLYSNIVLGWLGLRIQFSEMFYYLRKFSQYPCQGPLKTADLFNEHLRSSGSLLYIEPSITRSRRRQIPDLHVLQDMHQCWKLQGVLLWIQFRAENS